MVRLEKRVVFPYLPDDTRPKRTFTVQLPGRILEVKMDVPGLSFLLLMDSDSLDCTVKRYCWVKTDECPELVLKDSLKEKDDIFFVLSWYDYNLFEIVGLDYIASGGSGLDGFGFGYKGLLKNQNDLWREMHRQEHGDG